MNFSKNAIMAKSRALYGKRLTREDYENLIRSTSVNEVVAYLKAETAYAETFENANSDMSTSQVEELLKIHILKAFEKVSRYEISTGAQFYKYNLMKNDIQQILRFLQFLMADRPEEYLHFLPPFFNQHSELDLYSLASSRSFQDMLESLKGTVYYKTLKPFENAYKDKRSYLRMECALDEELWKIERDVIANYKGKSGKKIREIISYQNDMETLIRVYRLKRLDLQEHEVVSRFINTTCTNFTKKDIERMINASSAHEMLQQASQTYYKKHFVNYTFDSLESFTRKILCDKYKKEIRYSTDPLSIMISYFYLAENEVRNIIQIVEGIRYGMSVENIGALPII